MQSSERGRERKKMEDSGETSDVRPGLPGQAAGPKNTATDKYRTESYEGKDFAFKKDESLEEFICTICRCVMKDPILTRLRAVGRSFVTRAL